MPSTYIVFYGQQVYGEYEKPEIWTPVSTFPDGCYMLNTFTKSWYVLSVRTWLPINYSDLPPEVRLNCLLMGIST